MHLVGFIKKICHNVQSDECKIACVHYPHLHYCTLQLNIQPYRGEVCLVRGVSSTVEELEQVWHKSNALVLSAERNGETPDKGMLSSC